MTRDQIRQLLKRWHKVYLYYVGWPHEIWHYLVARFFGLEARIEPGVTWVGPGPRWQLILIALAPAAVGVCPLLISIWQLAHAEPRFVPFWIAMCVASASWLGACGSDLLSAWRFWRDPKQTAIRPIRIRIRRKP